ncbi:MAG: chemotaxis response regulator protein-glutamate methylesterase [Lachnospira sp.]|nr:chemotaxis response regulator protein-glutamate methylesterase [Lachnospira sp.]
MRKIKVLIVDDSVMFRELLAKALARDSFLEVVAMAADPYEARDAILKYKPDVMTLDIELPRMDGIEFLRKLMPQYPIPTVMVSALSDKVFEALKAGAVDFVSKPSGMNSEQLMTFVKTELATKIKIASTVKVSEHKTVENRAIVTGGANYSKDIVVAIGASTGGTEAILDVIKNFKKDIPGTLIVQHMPPGFTAMYAERLNNHCEVVVKEAKNGDRVLPGQVLLAPGDAHMRLVKVGGMYQVECKPGPKVSGHCPSVDVLFESVAKVAGKNALGIILTGMGKDGADGLLAMRKAGAKTIGQNEASCVVYGMPKVAYDIGAVEWQGDLHQIAQKAYTMLDSM